MWLNLGTFWIGEPLRSFLNLNPDSAIERLKFWIMVTSDRTRGAIIASAIGDGYGFKTEFKDFDEILKFWPPNGPLSPEGNPILVTDDTQMALAVGKAIMECFERNWEPGKITDALVKRFVEWLNDPKNDRAPGMTCLSSCERLERGFDWKSATSKNSKGCGANMRVMPVGLLITKGCSYSEIGALAQLQSAITHAHPTALAASEITAVCIAKLIEGVAPRELLDVLENHVEEQFNSYHKLYLSDIWKRPGVVSGVQFINRGWEEVLEVLSNVRIGLNAFKTGNDPCEFTGGGWIAEEAFGTALLCFLLDPSSVENVLKLAVVTGGDSDSIACLAGAFVGAHCGIKAIPKDWIKRIEYQKELNALANFYE